MFRNISIEFTHSYPFLCAAIAVADGDRVFERVAIFSERVEIDGNAVRRADLVLGEISFADVAPVIPDDI